MILSQIWKKPVLSAPVLHFRRADSLLRQKSAYFFSDKDNKTKKEDDSSKGMISLSDVWETISNTSQNIYYKATKMNKMSWALLLSLPLIYYLTRSEEAEEYAINYFEN